MNVNEKELKDDLKSFVKKAIVGRNEYINASTNLISLGIYVRGDSFYMREFVMKVITTFFNEKTKSLTIQNSQGTPAEIKLDDEINLLFDPDLSNGERGFTQELLEELKKIETRIASEPDKLTDKIIEEIDFLVIVSSLNKQIKNLYGEGMEILASRIVSELNIGNSNYLATIIKQKYTSFSTPNRDYWGRNEVIERSRKIYETLNKITLETQVEFGTSPIQLIEGLINLPYDKALQSRTSFKGKHLTIVCFKEKIEWRFSQEAVDAITAFVLLYGNDKSIESISMLTPELLNAA